MYGNSPQVSAGSNCVRDIELEIKQLNQSIKVLKKFNKGAEGVINSNMLYQIDSYDDRRVLFALYGAYVLKIKDMEAQLDKFMKEQMKKKK